MSDGLLQYSTPSPGVARLVLNNPAMRNAMTAEMTSQWVAVMTRLRTDSSIRCVVVTGAGTAFCSGGSLEWLQDTGSSSVDQLRDRMSGFYRDWLTVRDLPMPTIAAINGSAVGAGLALALACDIRYADPAARMSVPFASLGLHPGMATTRLLGEATSLAVTRDLLFTGRAVAGDEALRLGLVSAVEADVVAFALDAAARIAANAPVAVRLTKAALAHGIPDSVQRALEWDALAQPITMKTTDLQEGIAAAKERRPPAFSGN